MTRWTPRGALPFIAEELPDWAAMIAANLVVDGILTTWAASVRDSSIEPLAQRARKILQEEGAHKVHAEAWAKRICRAGGADRELLLRRIGEAWADASRWPGPDDDPGYREALATGEVAAGPAAVREQVRAWLDDLLREEGCEVPLSPSPRTGRDGTRTGGSDLPVLRLGRHRARVAVGRADHHAPGPLPGVQHVLRGRARRVRRA